MLFLTPSAPDSQVSEKDQAVTLTDKGYDDCERILGRSIFDPRDPWAPFVINSLKAKELFTRDKARNSLLFLFTFDVVCAFYIQGIQGMISFLVC